MRLSAHDASFLYTETASGPMHGVGITVLDGPATYREILDFYAARLHLVPRLRQKLAFVPYNFAHPKWVDDPHFRLENHLRPHIVPPNTTYQQAVEMGLKLGEPLLDRRRPLWLTYVLENVEGRTLLVQMSHHAFVDGATAVAMATVLTDASADAARPAPPTEPWRPAREPTRLELLAEALAEQATDGRRAALRSLAPQNPQLLRKATALISRLSRPVMQAPWNATLVGPKRQLAIAEYPLAAFKPIRRAFGGTINDIVVAVVTEGVARYLEHRGEYVTRQHLRLMCPVNVRDGNVDPTNLDGNRVSAMFPVLPAWSLGMKARYEVVRTELDRIKAEDEPGTLDLLQQIPPPAPPVAMAGALAVGTPFDFNATARLPMPPHIGPRPLQAGFNFTCTNVPGPSWTQYVAGYEVVRATGTMMLGGNLGFGVSVSSGNGVMAFGFTADPRLLPDVERMRDFVAGAFDELAGLGSGMLEGSNASVDQAPELLAAAG